MQYLRCRCEQLLSASRKRLEAARVCAFAARISTFASTTLKLLATTLCGAVMADGVATIPSIRPNGARSGLSDQLAQAVQISSSAQGRTSITLAKNFASKTTPFCSQWRASSQRAPNRRKLPERPGQSRRLMHSHFLVVFFALRVIRLYRGNTLKPRLICDQDCLRAKFRKQNHPNNTLLHT